MDRDLTKKKNSLLKSIMTNPKLSKTFGEAFAAPIGSTKREQAKSVLSIMRKLGGVSDGQGGPLMSSPALQNNQSSTPDYSNIMIFPAAPRFKTKAPQASSVNMDGQGGPNDGMFANYKPLEFSSPIFPSLNPSVPKISNPSVQTTPQTSGLNYTPNNFSPAPTTSSATSTPFYPTLTGALTSSQSSSQTPFYPTKTGAPIPSTSTLKQGDTGDAVKKLQDELVAGGYMTREQVNTGYGTYGPKTAAAVAARALGNKPPTSQPTAGAQSSGVSTRPATPPVPLTEADKIKQNAQQAVNQGTGPGLFAMGVADEKFGGSLDAYVNNLDKKLKADFNLDALESELSNLKAEKNNLVPTLQSYIAGKDNYLKFIDQLIDQTEDTLIHQDMGNPAVSNSYNNYLNYLYTLKGRQSQRYGNFLNSAIADYNADVERTQSNYEQVYTQYNNAITRQATIAQNEYNTLYQTMSDLYTNLEQAPIKQANLEALKLQNQANALIIAQNGVTGGTTPNNVDYWKDVKTYSDMITVGGSGDDKDSIDFNKIPAGGLVSLYTQNAYQGGDEAAMTEAIRRALTAKLSQTQSSDVTTISKIQTLLGELASNPDPAGKTFASQISASTSQPTQKLVSEYVLSNLGTIKSATSQLVSGSSGWFSKNKQPGLKDPEGWKNDYKNLDSGILDMLYNLASNQIQPGSTYANNPSVFINELFAGQNDKEQADNVASILGQSW